MIQVTLRSAPYHALYLHFHLDHDEGISAVPRIVDNEKGTYFFNLPKLTQKGRRSLERYGEILSVH